MKDLLHPISLTVALVGLTFLLRDLPARRRDVAWAALTAVYLLSALSFLFSISSMWRAIDDSLGTRNLAVPLAQSCVVALLACQQVVLSYWGSPADRARRMSRKWLGSGLAVISGLFVLFFLLTPAVQRPTDFTLYYAHDNIYATYLTLYISAYTFAELYLALACWRLAGRSPRTAVRIGLRIVSIGAAVTLGYSAVRIGNVIAAALGISLAGWEDFAWICGDVGTILTLVGWLVPTITAQVQRTVYGIGLRRAHRQLHPLWLAFHRAVPEIVLTPNNSTAGDRPPSQGISFQVYRRVVEIRDGQTAIRPYLDHDVRTASEQRHRAAGLAGDELHAAISADQIRAALTALTQGTQPTRLTDFADQNMKSSHPIEDLTVLTAVARHYVRRERSAPEDIIR
ncbi:MAB_1171c family putative transporter [Streptomyces sp. NPDC013978]|uniref:MAB_1171c family putative transporter n=1 Tax=Streptomyces sp. NPDC013978 TaxID=3364869 RepID=UPI0036FB04C3